MGDNREIFVVGAGAAGLCAARAAAESGAQVVVFERNPAPAIKVRISGGGKCNVTHRGSALELGAAFPARTSRFLRHALHTFGSEEVCDLLAAEGVEIFTRENGRVFPRSGRADDVVQALLAPLRRQGVVVRTGTRVTGVEAADGHVAGLLTDHGRIPCTRVIVTTGGVSYPRTGTTGDGIAWARALGHTIVPLRPALAPIGVAPALPTAWRGVAIRDALLMVRGARGIAGRFRGDLLFSHEGITGPAALEVSNAACTERENGEARLFLDVLPDLDEGTLDRLLIERVTAQRGKQVGTLLDEWFPRRMTPWLLQSVGVDPETRGYVLTLEHRHALVRLLKRWNVGNVGTVDITRGEVTAGGVALEEVDPRTMESRKIAGLYLAGEMLDVDGPVGGYNLQAAFSTGAVAGLAAARAAEA